MEWLTADAFAPLLDGLKSALEVVAPIGLQVMGAIIGVSLVPKIIYKFF
jgi:hypothetical protein